MAALSHEDLQKMPIEEVIKQQNVKVDLGLGKEEAKKRLEQFGPNAIEEKKVSRWRKLFAFFWGPIPWMIEIAMILSGLLERWPDFIMIVALLLINAALGFFQEFKAENAIDALKQKLALKARVLRDGTWIDIESKELVPGDIIALKLGNIIPADAKLLSGEYLCVDQAALTGESLPVNKKKGDIVYSGSIAKIGEMTAIVMQTGMNTFFGQTAKLVDTAKTTSHFQKAVVKIGNFLIWTTLAVAAVILVVSLFQIEVFDTIHEKIGKLVIFMLVLVIAGIPVALPAVLSVTMAIGANRMAKFKAIVSKLISIEELAGMDILCSDKTGTLTKNELTLGDILLKSGKDAQEVILTASLASKGGEHDAIDDAIIGKLEKKEALKNYQILKYTPFDPTSKRATALVKDSTGQTFEATKGAPQVILELCSPHDRLRDDITNDVLQLASRGYRTLGVAKSNSQGGSYEFLGLIPLFDPPREDTQETIEHIRDLGLQVKMVTGDHTAIAKELAGKLGLGSNIYPAEEILSKDGKFTLEQDELIEKANGFAQVFPEHKFGIVKHLQTKGHIVGMTGDGVNDAPALKQADVGIAVSNATDAARAASDLILTQPGLKVISYAIDESRRIFGRMKSYAMYRISETIRLLLFLLLSMLIFHTPPLSAIMIILIALLNDIPIMMIAYDHMEIEPRPVTWNMREVFSVATILAVCGVISTFGLYWIGDRFWHLTASQCSSLAFMGILCGGNLTIYLTRNVHYVFSAPLPEWRFVIATLFSQAVGTLATVYGCGTEDFVGIGWEYVGYSWLYLAASFTLFIAVKELIYRSFALRPEHKEKFHEQTSKKIG
ncbi:MAG: plasma-membrane proton-efflux P-type ATPase [Simkaniaceae bacterium]|nr:plasma-membrane proton-efflux P-type ATPase [Simkaniaceae bacterium]MCF7852971.1 plasma-membrane proton-efflux P-type ATPase [Simkaniaceae bacterium]